MNENTITLEIKKTNKKTLFEWTETLELQYENSKTVKEIEKKINKKQENQKLNVENKDSFLIDTYVLSMEVNPFCQPAMNTLEFETNDDKTIVNMYKNKNENITIAEKLLTLDKLLEKKIISYDEYLKQKNKLI